MRALLAFIAASAAAAAATPAQAERRGDGSLPVIHRGVDDGRVVWGPDHRRDGDFRRDRRDRRRDRFDSSVFVYDRDWQGDSAWRSNSFNDWWHERPHRSSPRWVSRNRGCTQMWWGGGTWRCAW